MKAHALAFSSSLLPLSPSSHRGFLLSAQVTEALYPGVFMLTTCGSYRRGASHCGDVDILFAPISVGKGGKGREGWFGTRFLLRARRSERGEQRNV